MTETTFRIGKTDRHGFKEKQPMLYITIDQIGYRVKKKEIDIAIYRANKDTLSEDVIDFLIKEIREKRTTIQSFRLPLKALKQYLARMELE